MDTALAPISLWLDGVSVVRRPSLDGDRDVDVVIIGAGFTGLWTAFYLRRLDPTLRIMVLEKEFAGFGASGRNGGWCSDNLPLSDAALTRRHGAAAASAMRLAVRASIDEVGARAAELAPKAAFHRGGTLTFARSAVEVVRGQAAVTGAAEWEADLRWLDATEVADITGAAGILGATFTPHCAVLNPAALVRGLADAVVAAGVQLCEDTTVIELAPRRVGTTRRTVRAPVVVLATEAYAARLPTAHRTVAPVYSLVTATEPLPEQALAEVGLLDRPTFSHYRHLVIYGQRTIDGRLVFGGRGAPYHFGSRIRGDFDRSTTVFASLQRTLRSCSRSSGTFGSPTAGAARWGSRGTGTPRSAWTGRPDWRGPVVMSATGSRPRTWPAGRWPI